jgi:predicted MFS family arabinose efflux permease
VYLVVMLEGLLVFGVLTFVPSLLHERLGITLSQAGAVVAAYGLGGLAYSRAASHVLRRLAPRQVARAGALLMGLGLMLIASMRGVPWAALGCALAGFGFFAMHNTLQFQATQLAPQARGLALSFFAASFFFGQSMGVPLAGWTLTHAEAAWTYGGAALGLVVLGTLYTAMWAHHEATAPRTP